jgi:hypothetical protein
VIPVLGWRQEDLSKAAEVKDGHYPTHRKKADVLNARAIAPVASPSAITGGKGAMRTGLRWPWPRYRVPSGWRDLPDRLPSVQSPINPIFDLFGLRDRLLA